VFYKENGFDLFLVGQVPEGQVAASLNVKSDCSELGPVGSLLTSPDFSTSRRVLPEEFSAVLPEEDLESK
jgi:hypothetical protein